MKIIINKKFLFLVCAGPPSQLQKPTASKITSSSVKLKWVAPDNDGKALIHSYQVRYTTYVGGLLLTTPTPPPPTGGDASGGVRGMATYYTATSCLLHGQESPAQHILSFQSDCYQ